MAAYLGLKGLLLVNLSLLGLAGLGVNLSLACSGMPLISQGAWSFVPALQRRQMQVAS
jgi:hypothetical protein